MKYTIIFSDLDGTIGDDNYQYSTENKAAIQRAKAKGIDIVLCSGRTPVSLVYAAERMGLSASYAIGFNGGTVWDISQGKALFNNTMPKDMAIEILSLIQHKTPAGIGVYLEPDLILKKGLKDGIKSLADEGVRDIETEDFANDIKTDILKILVMGDPKDLEKVELFIRDKIIGRVTMVYTAANILEFLPLNVNKGKGMIRLSEHMGISISQTVGIGDNYNDIELIQMAGIGIAVANAVPPLKEAARYITAADNNNSAFAEAVDHIISLNEGQL